MTRIVALLPLFVLTACAVPAGTVSMGAGPDADLASAYDGDDAPLPYATEVLLDVPLLEDAGETDAEGLVEAPEEVAVFVGEELLLDLALRDPAVGRILAADIPLAAVFEELDLAARVRWEPTLQDVGQHEFVFLVVDHDDDSLVLGTTVITVSVLPRNRFIEYGF